MSAAIIHEGTPPLAPGTCYLCKSAGGDGRKFIDFMRTVKFYGRVYFCSYCFEEVNNNLGWVSPANWDKAQGDYAATISELEEVKAENDSLRSTLDSSLSSLRSDISALLEAKPASNEVAPRRPGRPKKAESGTS